MNSRRLLTLAKYLYQKVPDECFEMASYVRIGKYEIIQEDPTSLLLEHACGTAACAAGWAATIPSFRKDGFKLDSIGNLNFSGAINGVAVQKFFNIQDYSVVDAIFGSYDKTVKPKLVASWIVLLVALGEVNFMELCYSMRRHTAGHSFGHPYYYGDPKELFGKHLRHYGYVMPKHWRRYEDLCSRYLVDDAKL